MAQNSLYFAFLNSTTVDNLTRKTKVYHFAVHVPDSFRPAIEPPPVTHFPAHPTTQPLNTAEPPPLYRTVTYPMADGTSISQVSPEPTRKFAILATPAGGNPYLLATPLANFKTVMGERWWDWFLPLRHSPCWDGGHGYPFEQVDSEHGGDAEKGLAMRRKMYKTGPVVDDMIRYAELPPLSERR
jgi:palmitoyltransferase